MLQCNNKLLLPQCYVIITIFLFDILPVNISIFAKTYSYGNKYDA